MNTKSLSDVDKVLEQLKQSGTARHIQNIDFTWDIINQSVITNEMLTFLLVKTSCLPIVPDFTAPAVVEKLNITNEQATLIQNFNSQLINVHGLLLKFIITEYVSSSIIKEMIDNEIELLPQTDMSYLLDFIKNYQENQSDIQQKGGQPSMILRIILTIIITSCVGLANTNLQLIDPTSKMYSSGIAAYTPDQFTEELQLQSRSTSGPIEISEVIAEYDRQIEEELQQFIPRLTQFLQITKRQNGLEVLQDFITNYNRRSDAFSREVESRCLELMVKAKQHDVFSEWTDIDTIEETQRKIDELTNDAEKQIDTITEDISKDLTGIASTAATTAATVVTGTLVENPLTTAITFSSYISSLGVNLYNYLSVTNAVAKEKKQLLEQQKTVTQQAESVGAIITREEKQRFELKIYEFASLYCSVGYNLKIKATQNSIQVYGDKVPYTAMIDLINALNDNLQLQITKMMSISSKDGSNRLIISALISLQQRLNVLKQITEMIGATVNRSAKLRLNKINEFPDPNSIEDVKLFFNNQLSQLEDLLLQLGVTFPQREKKMDTDIEMLQEEKRLAEKGIEIKLLQEDLRDIEQNETAIITQRRTDRFIRNGQNAFNATAAITTSWLDLGLGGMRGTASYIGKFTESLTDVVSAGPLSILDSSLKFLRKILYRLFTEPSLYIILVCGLLAFEIKIGGITGRIRIFLNAAKQLIVTIVIGPFILVYRGIKTPFGWVFRQISTLFMEKNQRAITQSEEDAIQGLLALRNKGGKRKKTYKNKNKKNKTKKIRHGKKRNTRHKRRRLTRRR
jgi:hypothetical protein